MENKNLENDKKWLCKNIKQARSGEELFGYLELGKAEIMKHYLEII